MEFEIFKSEPAVEVSVCFSTWISLQRSVDSAPTPEIMFLSGCSSTQHATTNNPTLIKQSDGVLSSKEHTVQVFLRISVMSAMEN